MTDYAEMIERLRFGLSRGDINFGWQKDCLDAADAIENLTRPRPKRDWHEDMGDVLWFHFPVQEPPWVGTPLTSTWIKNWYTHFLPLPDFNAVHADIASARAEKEKTDE